VLIEDIRQFNKRYLSQLVKAASSDRLCAANCYHLLPDVSACLAAVDTSKLNLYAEQSQTVLGVLNVNPDELNELISRKKAPSLEFKNINLNYLFLARSLALGDIDEAIIRLRLPIETLEVIKNLSYNKLLAIADIPPYCIVSCQLSALALTKLNEIHQYLFKPFSMLTLSSSLPHPAVSNI
jgi:hypothetical protein